MAAGVALAGSITATTGAVVSGASMLAGTVTTGGLGAGAAYVANNISAVMNNSVSQALTQATQTGKYTYYQVTSSEAAQSIAKTGELIPSPMEKSVCVLDFQPTLSQARQIGAHAYDTVIRFSTKLFDICERYNRTICWSL